MPRILFLLLILAVLFYVVYQYKRLTPDEQKILLKRFVVSAAVGLIIILVVTGRLSWLIAAIGALLPLIPRAARMLMGVWPTFLPFLKRYQQNKQSNMQSQFIRLQIDMLSGDLQGEVLQGEFNGQKLKDLTRQQIMNLLRLCQQQDAESASLLIAYLQRQHADWLADEAGTYEHSTAESEMSEQQARDILGVEPDADKPEINKAHKRLIQKLHPDRGGSDYLARQINRARDVLLNQR